MALRNCVVCPACLDERHRDQSTLKERGERVSWQELHFWHETPLGLWKSARYLHRPGETALRCLRAAWGGSSGLVAGGWGQTGGWKFLVGAEAAPQLERQKAESDDEDLAADEDHQPLERGVHEAVGVEANAEHVHAEPREAGHNVAEDRQVHNAAVAQQVAPSNVEDNRIPDHDEEGAVLLGVPAPEPAPGLVGPDAPQNGANEAEQGGEADDAIDHCAQGAAYGGF